MSNVDFENVFVRVNPELDMFEAMKTSEGWFVARGAQRVPDLHKHIKANIEAAVKAGCRLFATEGGIRIMVDHTGQGGVCFIEKKHAMTGRSLYLLPGNGREKCEKSGLTIVVSDSKNGSFVSPVQADGETPIFGMLVPAFVVSKSPKGFKECVWPGQGGVSEEKPVEVEIKTESPVAVAVSEEKPVEVETKISKKAKRHGKKSAAA